MYKQEGFSFSFTCSAVPLSQLASLLLALPLSKYSMTPLSMSIIDKTAGPPAFIELTVFRSHIDTETPSKRILSTQHPVHDFSFS